MKAQVFQAVIACAVLCSLPAAAFAACSGTDPSTSTVTYMCICNKWTKVKETLGSTKSCDGKTTLKSTESWGYDVSTCQSITQSYIMYEKVTKKVDHDCSSYTAAKSACCIAEVSHHYDVNKGVWDWGVQCEDVICKNSGKVQALKSVPYGTPNP